MRLARLEKGKWLHFKKKNKMNFSENWKRLFFLFIYLLLLILLLR